MILAFLFPIDKNDSSLPLTPGPCAGAGTGLLILAPAQTDDWRGGVGPQVRRARASPSIGLDKSGTLLAVGTGGLSVLAQAAADRIAGEKDSCAKMLEKTGGHPATKD